LKKTRTLPKTIEQESYLRVKKLMEIYCDRLEQGILTLNKKRQEAGQTAFKTILRFCLKKKFEKPFTTTLVEILIYLDNFEIN
jgi:hypothetical protein